MLNKRVFCIGVWDLLHVGHLSVIKQASSFGKLTVGVVKDEAVTALKGKNKPVIKENDRLELVTNIKGVASAYLVPDFAITKTMIEMFDVIVIGGDQTHIKNVDKIPPEKLIRLSRPNDGVSSTAIMKKIKGEN